MQNDHAPKSKVSLYVALDQQYITKDDFQDVYNHAGCNRTAIRGFIKYLTVYKQSDQKRKKDNPEPWTFERLQKER